MFFKFQVILHKGSICSLNFRLLSILIRKSFSHLLLEIAFFSYCDFTGVIIR